MTVAHDGFKAEGTAERARGVEVVAQKQQPPAAETAIIDVIAAAVAIGSVAGRGVVCLSVAAIGSVAGRGVAGRKQCSAPPKRSVVA